MGVHPNPLGGKPRPEMKQPSPISSQYYSKQSAYQAYHTRADAEQMSCGMRPAGSTVKVLAGTLSCMPERPASSRVCGTVIAPGPS